MSDELHIASLVVHALPARCEAVIEVVSQLPDARVHGTDPSGKLVVTLEGPTSHVIMDHIAQIQQTAGVIGVALVYQHIESLESLNTEIQHVDHTA